MTPREKGEDGGETESPETSPPDQTPFQRFEELARRVLSVPKAVIDERERVYRARKRRDKP